MSVAYCNMNCKPICCRASSLATTFNIFPISHWRRCANADQMTSFHETKTWKWEQHHKIKRFLKANITHTHTRHSCSKVAQSNDLYRQHCYMHGTQIYNAIYGLKNKSLGIGLPRWRLSLSNVQLLIKTRLNTRNKTCNFDTTGLQNVVPQALEPARVQQAVIW